MVALVCDICGGKLTMGTNGMVNCEYCGMQYTNERVREKVQEVRGVIQIDKSNMIDNWLQMAESAYESNNYNEAYDYYSKVIEISINNWRAIYKRGICAVQLGDMKNTRTNELRVAMEKAHNIVNETITDKKQKIDALSELANKYVRIYFMTIMNLQMTYMQDKINTMFGERVNLSNYYAIQQECIYILDVLQTSYSWIDGHENKTDRDKDTIEILKSAWFMAIKILCSVDIFNDCCHGLKLKEKQKYLSLYEWTIEEYLDKLEEDKEDIASNYPDPYEVPEFIYEYDYESREKQIKKYWENYIREIKSKKKDEIANKRYNDYWEIHAKEKCQYQKRLSTIDAEIKILNDDIEKYDAEIVYIEQAIDGYVIEENVEVNELNAQKNKLIEQKRKSGLFSGKRKREIQEQIDHLQFKISQLEQIVKEKKYNIEQTAQRRISEIEKKKVIIQKDIKELKKEKQDIEFELKKAR